METGDSASEINLSGAEKHHYRMGHFGELDGKLCDICSITKAVIHQAPKGISERHYERDELVVSDVWGRNPTRSMSRSRYFVSFTDAYSRYSTIYFLTSKDEVLDKLKIYNNIIKNRIGRSIRNLRSDNAGEYRSKEFKQYTDSQGIVHQFTIPYTPAQNGIAERLNRTILQIARALKLTSGLPDQLWLEIIYHASTIKNFSITRTTNKTPYELYTNAKPKTRNLLIFGSLVYIHHGKGDSRAKLDPTGVIGIYIGNGVNTKGYRIWLPRENKIVEHLKIIVDEDRLYKDVSWENAKTLASTDNLHFDEFNVRIGQVHDGGTKCKARFVALGYRQREGLDFDITYAPTTIPITLRIIFSLIAQHNLHCHQMDVSTAFLHGSTQGKHIHGIFFSVLGAFLFLIVVEFFRILINLASLSRLHLEPVNPAIFSS